MCEAFSTIGHEINLILPNLISENASIKDYYDLKKLKFIKLVKL